MPRCRACLPPWSRPSLRRRRRSLPSRWTSALCPLWHGRSHRLRFPGGGRRRPWRPARLHRRKMRPMPSPRGRTSMPPMARTRRESPCRGPGSGRPRPRRPSSEDGSSGSAPRKGAERIPDRDSLPCQGIRPIPECPPKGSISRPTGELAICRREPFRRSGLRRRRLPVESRSSPATSTRSCRIRRTSPPPSRIRPQPRSVLLRWSPSRITGRRAFRPQEPPPRGIPTRRHSPERRSRGFPFRPQIPSPSSWPPSRRPPPTRTPLRSGRAHPPILPRLRFPPRRPPAEVRTRPS